MNNKIIIGMTKRYGRCLICICGAKPEEELERMLNNPTEKNHKLLEELILDNSNEGDIIFDPCSGSRSNLYVAKNNNRRYLGCELQQEWFDKLTERLSE